MYTRYLLTLAVFAAMVAPAGAQQPSPNAPIPQQTQPTIAWLDHPRLATWSIGIVAVDQNTHRQFFLVIGTGVVIALDEHTGYFVTAKHVFYDPQKNWHPNELRIRFPWQEDRSVFDELGIVLKLRDAVGRDLWESLGDGSDLAAIAPPSVPITPKIKTIEAVFTGDFAKDTDLYQGAPTLVLGYPGVVGNEYLVRAIVRQGIVAWTSPQDPMQSPFMVDANVLPGNSGSPVFRIPAGLTREGSFAVGGTIAFLGIVSKGPIRDAPVTVDGQPISFSPAGQAGGHPVVAQIEGVGGSESLSLRARYACW